MKLSAIRVALLSLVGLGTWCTADSPRAQPLLNTENLCGPPGAGLTGTNWISLPSDGTLKTAEDICDNVNPRPFSVTQFYPDGTGAYTYECGTSTSTAVCSSNGPIPEPGCASATNCFCITPGEAVSVVTNAPSTLPIFGCDAAVTIDVPLVSGPSTSSTLVSVPFHTFLHTFNDLGAWFGLPSGLIGGASVSYLDCITGSIASCNLGSAACNAAVIAPGRAYRIHASGTGGIFSATNPVACLTPNPPLATCPIDSLTVSWNGTDATLTWNPPDPACTVAPPLTYKIARFDPDCIKHYCAQCASCTTLGTTMATTFSDTPPPGNWDYLVSVDGQTWNSTSPTQCVDRDTMFGLGCP